MRYLAALYSLLALALLAALAFAAWKVYTLIGKKGGGVAGAAAVLKESTPLGIPSRAIDAGISAATGREETLGTWLAGVLSADVRHADKLMERAVKPVAVPNDLDAELRASAPYVWSEVDTELRRLH
jgi:hypothetical protein